MFARFSIDDGLCIGCGLCREIAPHNLGTTPEMASRVVAQPDNDEDERNCLEASECCPMGALAQEHDQPEVRFESRALSP